MKQVRVGVYFFLFLVWTASSQGQQPDPAAGTETQRLEQQAAPAQFAQATMPRLVRVSSVARDPAGRPLQGMVGVTFAFYEDQEGGAPLWLENQTVEADDQGRYAVLLGITEKEGLPLELFTAGKARWLGIQVQGEAEQARILLVAVPYALKAADAETLGGKPPSAYVEVETQRIRNAEMDGRHEFGPSGDDNRTAGAAGSEAGPSESGDEDQSSASTAGPGGRTLNAVNGSGTANKIPKFSDSTTLADSTISESGSDVNINPSGNLVLGGAGSGARLHLKNAGSFAMRFENTSGGSIFNFVVDNPSAAFVLTKGSENTSILSATTEGNVAIGGFPAARFHVKNVGSLSFRLENTASGGSIFSNVVDNPSGTWQLTTGTANTPIMTAKTDGTISFAQPLTLSGDLHLGAGSTIDTPSGDLNLNPSANIVFGGTGSGAKVHFKNKGSFSLRLENTNPGGSVFNYVVDNPSGTLQLTTGTANTSILTATTDGTITFAKALGGNLAVDSNTLFVDSTNHRVGVGTPSPAQKLEVNGNVRLAAGGTIDTASGDLNINPPANIVLGGTGSGAKVHFKNQGSFAVRFENTAGSGSVFSWVVDNPAGTLQLTTGIGNARILTAKADGSVGIGTATPAAALHVAGDIVADGNIAASYQDLAEWVFADRPLAAGVVVVIDKNRSNWVLPSSKPYDVSVVGVVSATPGVLLGQAGKGKVKVASTGRVKVRVDASKAPIRAGDLLVSSDKEGMAMRSIPVNIAGVEMHRPGTLVGKALEALPGGEGEILVVLSSQ